MSCAHDIDEHRKVANDKIARHDFIASRVDPLIIVSARSECKMQDLAA